MSRRPVILLDVDGPLTESFFSLVCRELKAHGIYVRPSQLRSWSFAEAVGATPEVERAIRERLRRPGVASGFEPNVGARQFVRDLREWADVYAVTAPLDGSPTWSYERETWLVDQFGFDLDHVMPVRHKHLVHGDAIVEDKHEAIVAWHAAHPQGLAVLWTEPHNVGAAWDGPRASTYDRLEQWLEALRTA